MSKKLTSTLLLLLIGVGFGIWSVQQLLTARQTDDVIQALLYMVPAVAALGALVLLPFKRAP